MILGVRTPPGTSIGNSFNFPSSSVTGGLPVTNRRSEIIFPLSSMAVSNESSVSLVIGSRFDSCGLRFSRAENLVHHAYEFLYVDRLDQILGRPGGHQPVDLAGCRIGAHDHDGRTDRSGFAPQ